MSDSSEKHKDAVRTVVSERDRSALSGKPASLVVIYGEDLGRKYNLNDPSIVIGRSSKCDIQVDQTSASRTHTKIVNTGSAIIIRDLGSTNGTYVNDDPIDEYTLRNGDLVKVGRTIFKFITGADIEGAYHEEIYRLKTIDGLTQTFNRNHFLERLERENSRFGDARRMTLVALKLNLATKADDDDPDMTLRLMVRELKRDVSDSDVIGRYSDQVMMVLSEVEPSVARARCETLVGHLSRSDDALLARSSLSMGLAPVSAKDGSTPLVKEALRRLEAATRLGPNCIVDYPVPLHERVASRLQSTFISYGGPDHLFARKLNEALRLRGVQTFFFQDDASPGDKLHEVMRSGVNAHDRVILVCSKDSLERKGLLNELEETLARESREGGATYLLPIRLDDYVIEGWAPKKAGLAQTIRDRVIADFREHNDPTAFAIAMARLMIALSKDESAPAASAPAPRDATRPG